MPPPLIYYASDAEYRTHFEIHYCGQTIKTFDGYRVFFPKQQFDDAFYESANRKTKDKSVFSNKRAERIDWIRTALEDATAEVYAGWDRDKKRINNKRRVALVYHEYVIVLQMNLKRKSATFITAYVADNVTIAKIRRNPKWAA